MCRPTLTCPLIVLLTTGLMSISSGNQDIQRNVQYSRGEDCRFVYSSLKYVCDHGAGITLIPSPCCISHVRYLEITDNLVASLRKREFGRVFSNLLRVDLRNNRINRIHQGAFVMLRKLQVLDLSGNRLTSLADGVFKGLSSLTTLRLGGNGMVSMHQGAFRGLPSLTVLRLDNNNLHEIQEEVFEPLQRLKSLHLDMNRLSQLDTDSFAGLQRLRTLSVTSNQLHTIPDILSELPGLTDLILNNNPLVCDCRVAFLHRWFAESTSNQNGKTVLCMSPQRFRGLRLSSVSPHLLCQATGRAEPSLGFPFDGKSFSSTPLATYPELEASIAGAEETPPHSGATDPDQTQSTPRTASPKQRTEPVFFDDIPVQTPTLVTPLAKPAGPFHPGRGRPEPPVTSGPNLKPGIERPNPRPGHHPPDAPGGEGPTTYPNPSGPEYGPASSGPRPPGKPSSNDPVIPTDYPQDPNLDPGGINPLHPTISSGSPGENPNGSSNGTTGLPNQPNNPSGQPHDADILTSLAPVTVIDPSILTGSVVVIHPDGDAGITGPDGPTATETPPNTPLIVYGVEGQNVVLLCGNDELDPKPRVKWLLPHGRSMSGTGNRLKLEADGSLRIKPFQRRDIGSYRCIVRNLASSKVILVRLRAACPCRDSTSAENNTYEIFPNESYPVPAFSCSWTPLVIAVVTTFQGTVAFCALVFCVWYTRCHRRKNFTFRVEDAEKRDSKRLRNSDMSVLRDCPSSTVASITDTTGSTTGFDPASLRSNDSFSAASSRTSNALSDYMNSYMTQQMRRQQYQLRLPVPDYVDLDPKSRDPQETLYSSLRGRDFSNRRRIVTQ